MVKYIGLFLTVLFLSHCTARDTVTTDIGELPGKAQDFVGTYFSNEELSYIKIDYDLTKKYELMFVSGTEVDFSKDGEWLEVDCKDREVPAGIVHDKIVAYVTQNFPKAFVTRIEKDGRRYEVALSNRLELRFDKNYDFIRVDD